MQNNTAIRTADDLPEMLQSWQKQGAEFIAAHGLPTLKTERWKYTNTKLLEKFSLVPKTNGAAKAPAMPLVFDTAGQITFVDGVFSAAQSIMPKGIHVIELADADKLLAQPFNSDQYFGALNAKHAMNGVVITVPSKTSVDLPIIIRHVNTNGVTAMPRIIINLEDQAEATIVDVCHGEGAYFANAVYDVTVGQNARLHHYRWQNETVDAAHITTSTVRVARDASYDSFVLTMGAALARQDITAHLVGENAECRLNGVYLSSGTQHHDTTILVHHEQPHGSSNQTFKGIVDDTARAVFQGKVFVHKGAQKTDGYQLNNALLLSDKAEVDVKPELEIYADDVKCSHGATTGQLDTGPLFYLRTRGLSEAQAKFLLMQVFLGPALDEIRDDIVRQTFSDLATQWLETHCR